jgi:Family of unknown function (DUF6065)
MQGDEDAGDVVTFYRFIEAASLPTRAGRGADGSIPARALQYCEALTTANAYGWHVYPPMDMSFLWDYDQIFWSYAESETWMPLGAAQFPRQVAAFDHLAPHRCKGYSPPFLTAIGEPGVVQIWTGFFARTAPGWSLQMRAPVNRPPSGSFRTYEGIVEADEWFAPLFVNVQLTATNQMISIEKDLPLIQIQPLPRAVYSDRTMRSVSTRTTMSQLSERDWSDFYETIVVDTDCPSAVGRYAQAVRRRRRNDERTRTACGRQSLPTDGPSPPATARATSI